VAVTPKPEVKKGQGPDQLPQGAATDINTAPVGTPPQDVQPAAPAAPAPQQPQAAIPADFEPKFVPQGDDETYITGPTTRPNESVTAGASSRQRGISASLRRDLPALVHASTQPGAPEQMRFIVDFLIREAAN